MRNRMYGGVRGRKMKVGGKLLHFPPTRFPLFNSYEAISVLRYTLGKYSPYGTDTESARYGQKVCTLRTRSFVSCEVHEGGVA